MSIMHLGPKDTALTDYGILEAIGQRTEESGLEALKSIDVSSLIYSVRS